MRRRTRSSVREPVSSSAAGPHERRDAARARVSAAPVPTNPVIPASCPDRGPSCPRGACALSAGHATPRRRGGASPNSPCVRAASLRPCLEKALAHPKDGAGGGASEGDAREHGDESSEGAAAPRSRASGSSASPRPRRQHLQRRRNDSGSNLDVAARILAGNANASGAGPSHPADLDSESDVDVDEGDLDAAAVRGFYHPRARRVHAQAQAHLS